MANPIRIVAESPLTVTLPVVSSLHRAPTHRGSPRPHKLARPTLPTMLALVREPEPIRTVSGLLHQDCLHPIPPVELHPYSTRDDVARIHEAERAACLVCTKRAA